MTKISIIIKSSINYTLITITNEQFSIFKIKYSLVTIYKEFLDSPKKICWEMLRHTNKHFISIIILWYAQYLS